LREKRISLSVKVNGFEGREEMKERKGGSAINYY